MSLFQRKVRPLKSPDTRLRDDRLFYVACDDTYAPKQYFNFFEIPRIHVIVVETSDGTSSAGHVLDRLLEQKSSCFEDDELWLLLDTDHYTSGRHIKSFRAAIKKAKQHGVNIALSKPCFELWLLLHHRDEDEVADLVDASGVEARLREVFGEYNKTRLKLEHYPAEQVPDAIRRAARLDKRATGGDIPAGNTSRVYLLWQAIIDKALPSQLPTPLAELKL